MLDRDLAELYGVETRTLNQAVKRNIDRFPETFMFQLTEKEFANLKSQFVTSSWGGVRKTPYVFTEHGTLQLSSVLKSKIAIRVSIQIVETFVKIRKMLSNHKELKDKIEYMERKYDQQFRVVFEAIRHLIEPSGQKQKQIGFRRGEPSHP